jgi:acetolactate synthase-1/2/3 large subunit
VHINGADALILQLKLEKVEHIFGIPGVQLDFAMDALFRLGDGMQYIQTRHEQACVYMADGYARSTGKVGVAMVVPGPGVLNTMAALATAYATSSAVLCISGALPRAVQGKGWGVLHEVPHQSDLFDSVTKWHAMARNADEVPALVREAFRQLGTGRPRPVVLEIPADVLEETAEVQLQEPLGPEPDRLDVDRSLIEQATQLMNTADRPVVYVGSGVQLADACDHVRATAEALQAPVVMSRSGLGSLPADHPLALTKLEGLPLIREADAVLVVGSRFMGFGGKAIETAPEAQVIQIDADPNSMSPPRRQAVAINADARVALSQLNRSLTESAPRPHMQERLRQLRDKATRDLSAMQPQMQILTALRSVMPRDAVLVSEVTQIAYLVRIGFPFYVPRTNITSGYQGTLGFGFPTALGAKIGRPDRVVVSLTGDGGFGWALQELATARKYDIAVVTVLFNDGAFGNVRRTQKDRFGSRFIGTDLVNPDFLALAGAFGVSAVRAQDVGQLSDCVEKAIDSGEPYLIEMPIGETPDPWHLLG